MVARGVPVAMLVAIMALVLSGTHSVGGADPAGASAVEVKTTPESELGVIKLSARAESRLGITTAAVEQRAMPRRREYGADLIVPPGRVARLFAPFAGVITAHPRGVTALPGTAVRRGAPLLGLQPILTEPERLRLAEVQLTLVAGRADAEGQLKRAEAAARLARVQVERGSALLEAEAGSQKGLDEARANLASAEANLAAAKVRRDLYATTELAAPGALPVTGLEAPLDGVLRDVSVVTGQMVAAGAALAEVADLSVLWARVPVPMAEAGAVETTVARVRMADDGRADGAGDTGWVSAKLVAAPPTASATAVTVDRYYELANQPPRWTPGMRVLATLLLAGRAAHLVVPWSAVVMDVNGGSWVYARPAAHTFARKRVSVERVDGDLALLSTGPSPGTTIAVNGVAELFGIDVGFAK